MRWQKSKSTTPENKADLWLRAAKILEEKGDRDGAIERYKAALDAQAQKNEGRIKEAAEKLKPAIYVMRQLEGAGIHDKLTVPMVERAVSVMKALRSIEDGDYTQLAEVVSRAPIAGRLTCAAKRTRSTGAGNCRWRKASISKSACRADG